MAKFYCASGTFRNIVDALNPMDAAKKTLRKIIETETDLGLLMILSEKGFNSKTDNLITPTIPILRILDFPIGDNFELEKLICMSLKINREDISTKELNWLITGDLEEGEGDVTKN